MNVTGLLGPIVLVSSVVVCIVVSHASCAGVSWTRSVAYSSTWPAVTQDSSLTPVASATRDSLVTVISRITYPYTQINTTGSVTNASNILRLLIPWKNTKLNVVEIQKAEMGLIMCFQFQMPRKGHDTHWKFSVDWYILLLAGIISFYSYSWISLWSWK